MKDFPQNSWIYLARAIVLLTENLLQMLDRFIDIIKLEFLDCKPSLDSFFDIINKKFFKIKGCISTHMQVHYPVNQNYFAIVKTKVPSAVKKS
jgi:hypothetical protein